MQIIDGKKIAGEILERLKALPKPEKFLAGVLAGQDAASASFLKRKEKTAKELGIDFRLYEFPADISQDNLREKVGKIAAQKTCGGVIVQLPLPKQINRHYVLNAIPREKDVDVLGERALGAFYTGRNPVLPPAAGVVQEILSAFDFSLPSSRIAVVGRGILVGRPIASWLMGQVRELIVLGRNADLSILKDADLVILGADKANIVKPDMLKVETGVIDFGYAEVGGKLSGNLDTSGDLSHLAFYTPTPGGTGPILVAKLMENFYKLNEK
ncbi:MAG: bifunctional 5,10-methylenetetrahydrofolate dehydrogenase/5,10-methenyltetrahydrofolate cyclohydrolase [Patescibacteria group bacterium]